MQFFSISFSKQENKIFGFYPIFQSIIVKASGIGNGGGLSAHLILPIGLEIIVIN
jgi:hypothetical protein